MFLFWGGCYFIYCFKYPCLRFLEKGIIISVGNLQSKFAGCTLVLKSQWTKYFNQTPRLVTPFFCIPLNFLLFLSCLLGWAEDAATCQANWFAQSASFTMQTSRKLEKSMKCSNQRRPSPQPCCHLLSVRCRCFGVTCPHIFALSVPI